MSEPWVHISQHAAEAKEYIRKRKTGEIKSLLTPWDKLNKELLNGLEWNSVYELAGGSGTGKTAIKDQLSKGLVDLNPDQDFMILDFQFEMLGRTGVIRDLSRETGKSMKELSSAFLPISDTEFSNITQYLDRDLSEYPIYTVETPKSTRRIENIVKEFYLRYRKPMVVTIDHSMLVGKDEEKDDFEVIRRIAEMLIRTKKELPIIWVILNQLNREFERQDRQIPNSINAFPTKKDIYGGDSLYFASDGVIIISRPDQYMETGKYYGPSSYNIVITDDLLVWHILKNRVGEPNVILPMKADFASMTITDPDGQVIGAPPRPVRPVVFSTANQIIR